MADGFGKRALCLLTSGGFGPAPAITAFAGSYEVTAEEWYSGKWNHFSDAGNKDQK